MEKKIDSLDGTKDDAFEEECTRMVTISRT